MKKKDHQRLLIEAFLIVFSVLLALFLNRTFENYKLRQQKKIAKESMIRDIEHNIRVSEEMYILHKTVVHRLDSIAKLDADAVKAVLFDGEYFRLHTLTGDKPLMKEFLSSTSWETARSTGIIAEFDYAQVEKLTTIYALQDFVINKSFFNLTDLLFRPETHDAANVNQTLIQLRLRFGELVGQEGLLISSYKAGLESLASE